MTQESSTRLDRSGPRSPPPRAPPPDPERRASRSRRSRQRRPGTRRRRSRDGRTPEGTRSRDRGRRSGVCDRRRRGDDHTPGTQRGAARATRSFGRSRRRSWARRPPCLQKQHYSESTGNQSGAVHCADRSDTARRSRQAAPVDEDRFRGRARTYAGYCGPASGTASRDLRARVSAGTNTRRSSLPGGRHKTRCQVSGHIEGMESGSCRLCLLFLTFPGGS